jgi:phosphoribosylaminoimidazolecarboxamide formyltransferase / IMP cyclohydrolase
MPRALLSVSDKTGLVDLARGLIDRGFELLSTGGTAKALSAAGVPVTNVSEVTGFPEMMDGRVKTLHPKIHGGILARRSHPDDLAALASQGIGLIDVVVVNLYPFEQAARKPGVTFDELIENIDIGGPSLVRAAAKNFQDVLIVVDPADYSRLLAALDQTPALDFRFHLMRKAIEHTGAYDTVIGQTLRGWQIDQGGPAAVPAPTGSLPSHIDLALEKIRDLRYGENPHQPAAWYGSPGAVTFLQGKELSYTNLLDLDAAARIAIEFTEPAAVVIKHTNPCGAATGSSLAEAYVRAREADSLAAYGGIVGLNRALDVASAEAIVATFIEAVIAPAVDQTAREILARKANMRVVTTNMNGLKAGGVELRSILGGSLLAQQRDRVVEAQHDWGSGVEGLTVVTKRQPTAAEWQALRFAWRVCAHVKSNTVIFTDATRTLAIGAGQMSRVDSVNVAVMKAAGAGVSLTGAAVASDAFFPFRDGLDALAKAGATAVVQPGGSKRDDEVIASANEHGIAMVFTGRRHFRH